MFNALMMVLIEVFKAIFLKVAFKVILERFAQRALIWSFDRLVKMSTNNLDDETWGDIRAMLTGKKLRVIEEYDS